MPKSIEEILAPSGDPPMTPLAKFYTDDPHWHAKIGDIHALLERVRISEERSVPLNVPLNVPAHVGVNVGYWEVIERAQ